MPNLSHETLTPVLLLTWQKAQKSPPGTSRDFARGRADFARGRAAATSPCSEVGAPPRPPPPLILADSDSVPISQLVVEWQALSSTPTPAPTTCSTPRQHSRRQPTQPEQLSKRSPMQYIPTRPTSGAASRIKFHGATGDMKCPVRAGRRRHRAVGRASRVRVGDAPTDARSSSTTGGGSG